jgi:DDE superfamily endonuclease
MWSMWWPSAHGTLSLYAALDNKTGRVHGKMQLATPAGTSSHFSKRWCHCARPRQQIHVILNNLAAHKTRLVRDFLQRHPRVQSHFTPPNSSRLNQVEIWFAKIEREVIARGIFTPVPDLARKLRH